MVRRNPKNPIDDLGSLVGGWLGGSARTLNTFLTGDRNPAFNPQTRQSIRAIQEIGNATTGGAVLAMQQGPEAVQRYMATQAALAAAGGVAGAVAPRAIAAAARTTAGKAVVRKGYDAAFRARMLTPMTRRQAIRTYQRPAIQKLLEARGEIQSLQDQVAIGKIRATSPDFDYMDLYESYNPTARQAAETAVQSGDEALSQGRRNRILMDAANAAFRDVDQDWNQEEIRFAKRWFRERGRAKSQVLKAKQAYVESLPAEERIRFIARQRAQRAARLQRQLDISNARRNMPENYIDPEEFYK